MNIELLLVQFLVLGFTGVLWWIARRDLAGRTMPVTPPATEDLEQLCATLENVVTDLARRLETLEQRVAQAAVKEVSAPFPVSSVSPPAPALSGNRPIEDYMRNGVSVSSAMQAAIQETPTAQETREPMEARYAPVYALLDEGVTDASEIARRTGLSRGEVDLILGLRARRAL